jgi:hypothetical protein
MHGGVSLKKEAASNEQNEAKAIRKCFGAGKVQSDVFPNT